MDFIYTYYPFALMGLAGFIILSAVIALFLRRVVDTNMVHIVQSRGQTTSYGTTGVNGNVYYAWPSWIPVIGIRVTELPINIFKLELDEYMAYDVDRVPFSVDVVAFFRIENTNMAAQRVNTLEELSEQLDFIVKGAVRTVLASHPIDNIMLERSTFGELFTKEVEGQLKAWGVVPVKQLELMDIRDAEGSKVIENIMAKKQSFIAMESRKEVAGNTRQAVISEQEALRDTELNKQQALEAIGKRTAEKDLAINVANEKTQQTTNDQKKITKEKEMAVVQVEQVKQAEITKAKEVVAAEQDRDTTTLIAEGKLNETKKQAEGIKVQGEARAAAEKAMQMAPVEAQIALAKEIGKNPEYQQYLLGLKGIDAQQAIGTTQANALAAADIKVIANAGTAIGGVESAMDLFSSKGGTNMAAMLEGLTQSPMGKALMDKLGVVTDAKSTKKDK